MSERGQNVNAYLISVPVLYFNTGAFTVKLTFFPGFLFLKKRVGTNNIESMNLLLEKDIN
jgi:hypothetical protein